VKVYGPSAKEKSSEAKLTPLCGVPADIIDPLLDEVIAGTISLKKAQEEAKAIKAEARMAHRVNLILATGAPEYGTKSSYEEILKDKAKSTLVSQFKGISNSNFLSLTCSFSSELAKKFHIQERSQEAVGAGASAVSTKCSGFAHQARAPQAIIAGSSYTGGSFFPRKLQAKHLLRLILAFSFYYFVFSRGEGEDHPNGGGGDA